MGRRTSGISYVSYTLLLPLLGNDSRTDTVYGRIPAAQTGTAPGDYADTIIATVEYLAL